MEGFKPTIIGIGVYVVSMAQINEALQALLIIATLVYTVIKIIQLLDKFDKNKLWQDYLNIQHKRSEISMVGLQLVGIISLENY